jgi:hypothetical protein
VGQLGLSYYWGENMSDASQSSTSGLQLIIFEFVENAVDKASNANDFILKPIAASEAFRKYN